MTPARQQLSLNPAGFDVLADALGDTPETVTNVHRLRRGLCTVCGWQASRRTDVPVKPDAAQ